MSEFLMMDGYAMFVWPSFMVTLAALVIMAVMPWLRYLRLRSEILERGGRR